MYFGIYLQVPLKMKTEEMLKDNLMGKFTQKWKFKHYLFSSVAADSLVKFLKLHSKTAPRNSQKQPK